MEDRKQSLLSPSVQFVELVSSPDITSASQSPLSTPLASCEDNETHNSLLDSEWNLTMFPRENSPVFPLEQRLSERSESQLFVSREPSKGGNIPDPVWPDPNDLDPDARRLSVERNFQPTVEDVSDYEGHARGQMSPQHKQSITILQRQETVADSSPERTAIQRPHVADPHIVDVRSRQLRNHDPSKRPFDFSQMQANSSRKRARNDSIVRSQSSQVTDSSRASTSSTQSLDTSSINTHQSHYMRSFEALNSRFGMSTEYHLKNDQIDKVIEAGDSIIRDDLREFISSYLNSHNRSMWDSCTPYAPHNGPSVERVFKSLRSAEILTQRCSIDHVRLRQAQVLLQCYYEQLCNDPQAKKRRARGRNSSSVANDTLHRLYSKHTAQHGYGTAEWKSCRDALQRQRETGMRWKLLVKCLGPGLLLACSSKLAAPM